jgi:hypothetical protein
VRVLDRSARHFTHSVIVELNIPSYRMEEAKKNRDPAQESNAAN